MTSLANHRPENSNTMLHLQAVDLSFGERHREVLVGTAEFATEPSTLLGTWTERKQDVLTVLVLF
jgi:hypothetical protein